MMQWETGFFSSVKSTEPTSESTKLEIEWDGKNRHGRTVGNGTYLVILKAEDLLSPNVETGKLFIGVRKE